MALPDVTSAMKQSLVTESEIASVRGMHGDPLVGVSFSRFILEARSRIRPSWRVKNWDPHTTPGDVYCDLTIADEQVIVSANTRRCICKYTYQHTVEIATTSVMLTKVPGRKANSNWDHHCCDRHFPGGPSSPLSILHFPEVWR